MASVQAFTNKAQTYMKSALRTNPFLSGYNKMVYHIAAGLIASVIALGAMKGNVGGLLIGGALTGILTGLNAIISTALRGRAAREFAGLEYSTETIAEVTDTLTGTRARNAGASARLEDALHSANPSLYGKVAAKVDNPALPTAATGLEDIE